MWNAIRSSGSLETVCRWAMALVFFFAGIPKLLDVDGFAEIVAAYGLVPDALVGGVAFLIAMLEVVAALGLLLKRPEALFLTAALMGLFIGVLSWGIWLGLDIDCGCFAKESAEHKAFSGLRGALIRDLLLLFPLAFLLQCHVNKENKKEWIP